MSNTNTYHTEQFTIRANEVDTNGKLSLPAICNYFQEVAGNNAKDLNFDITDMMENNLTWVLHRMDINLKGKADWRDTVTVETWPASGDALRAYRNYRLLDDKGNEFGNCLSYWMVMNIETRRPTRIPKEVLDTKLAERSHVCAVKSNRIRPFNESGSEKKIIVRKADMDMNNHVNNVRYIEWMLETIPQERIDYFKNFDVIFMQESFVDEDLVSASKTNETGSIEFKITNSKNEVLAVANAMI